MSSVNSFETDMRKLRRKRKRKRIAKNIMAVLAVLIVSFAVYLSRSLWLPYFEGILERSFNRNNPGEAELSHFPIDVSRKVNVDIDCMDDCWLLFADTSFSTMNPDGDEVFSVYLPYTNPIVEATSKRALVYDMGGYNFSVVNRKSEVFSKKLENQILFASVGEKGNVAVVTSTDKYQSYLTVYDKNGTEIYHWADGNLITAVTLDDSGSKALVSSVYAVGGGFKSVISILDFSKTEIVAKTSPIETLCLSIEYTSKQGFWVLGDSALFRFNLDCELQYSYKFGYDISGFVMKDDLCAIRFEAVDGKSTYISLFDSNVDNAYEISYSDKVNCMDIYNDRIYINIGTLLNEVDYTGKLLGTTHVDSDCRDFAICRGNVYTMGYKSINKQELNSLS